MARLHPAATHPAAADLQLVAADLGRSGCGQVLLPLAGDPLHDQRTAARRAHPWQPHRHHPVDPLRRRPPPAPPVRLARFAARPPRVRVRPVLGERRGLALAHPPQLLDLGEQLPTRAWSRWFSPTSRSAWPASWSRSARTARHLASTTPTRSRNQATLWRCRPAGTPRIPVIAARTIQPDQQNQRRALWLRQARGRSRRGGLGGRWLRPSVPDRTRRRRRVTSIR
jgi:hypothetical protein